MLTQKVYAERFAPVGSYEGDKSPYGIYDLAGNVGEWVADWYGWWASDYYAKSSERNPKGPPSGQSRVVRGGSWYEEPDVVRSSYRGWGSPTLRNGSVGFRCAGGAQ